MSVSYVLGSFDIIGLSVEILELNILAENKYRIVGFVNVRRKDKRGNYHFSGELDRGNLFLSFTSQIPKQYEDEAYHLINTRIHEVVRLVI